MRFDLRGWVGPSKWLVLGLASLLLVSELIGATAGSILRLAVGIAGAIVFWWFVASLKFSNERRRGIEGPLRWGPFIYVR